MRRLFSAEFALWMPGVSRNTIWASGVVVTPWIEVRVVCGLSATMATFWPTSAFRSADLPAFGLPMRDTKPERKDLFMSYRLRFADAALLDPPVVAGQHFHADPV